MNNNYFFLFLYYVLYIKYIIYKILYNCNGPKQSHISAAELNAIDDRDYLRCHPVHMPAQHMPVKHMPVQHMPVQQRFPPQRPQRPEKEKEQVMYCYTEPRG